MQSNDSLYNWWVLLINLSGHFDNIINYGVFINKKDEAVLAKPSSHRLNQELLLILPETDRSLDKEIIVTIKINAELELIFLPLPPVITDTEHFFMIRSTKEGTEHENKAIDAILHDFTFFFSKSSQKKTNKNTSVYRLSQREKICLFWVAQGKSSWETSKIIGITERAVNLYITNAIKKTQSINRQQAITKCLILREII